MPLLPYSICAISTDYTCGMRKYITFCVSCGTDTNIHKIYIHDHPSLYLQAQTPFFVCPQRLCAAASLLYYCTLPPLVLKMKQTLETTLKTSWENKLPLKVIFPLTLDTALCFTSKNSFTATVIRIGSCWMYYSWGDIFTDLSLYVCLCMFPHISWACRGDFVGLIHGQWRRGVESELLCHIQ